MVVLLAMLAEDSLPGSITIERLVARVRTIVQRSAALRTEFADALADDSALVALLEEHPIAAWVGGRGTAGEKYFSYESRQFAARLDVPDALRDATAALVREITEWRLAQYIRRTGIVDGAPRIVCRVSHAGSQPILFLPSRDRVAGIPEGWVDVTADAEPYLANFVKVAVNVMHRKGAEANVLGEVLRKWFGEGAGQPGTSHRVMFQRLNDEYVLSPDRGEAEEHKYTDAFLDPSTFQWQSQNRTARESDAGKRLAGHEQLNIGVHLFVRAAAKQAGKTMGFVYAGPLRFVSWEGDKPITVRWKLDEPVPASMRHELGVPEKSK